MTIDFPDDEFRALQDVLRHAPRVDWTAYDRARARILLAGQLLPSSGSTNAGRDMWASGATVPKDLSVDVGKQPKTAPQ